MKKKPNKKSNIVKLNLNDSKKENIYPICNFNLSKINAIGLF